MCTLKDFERISLCQGHTQNTIQELDDWHKYLLPVASHTQLDIGAGCGETAFVYLNHGVERVICVEGNKECLENLRKNFGNDERVIIIPYFVGNIKIDIDRGEKNMILETHFPYRMRKLKRVAPFTHLNIIEEYWGNPLRKAFRIIGRKIS
jgi:protein-L-isoaspartate O-methyltransferase